MIKKTSIQCLDDIIERNDLTIPTDYVMMKKKFKKELFNIYLSSLKNGHIVLDLNSGIDGLYNELAQSPAEYLSLEQNPQIREFLTKNGIKAEDWNIPEIPLPDNSVNYVLSVPFIEHLPTYLDAVKLLIEIKRVLRPGGKLLMVVPNYLRLKEIFFEDYKHGWVTTKKRMNDMLLDCQYEITDTRYTIGWITMRRTLLIILGRFLISIGMTILRFGIVSRCMELIKLESFGYKLKKTLFELIVIEAKTKG
ncbi:methyltransferase domain-containing protein [Desulfobacterota bacterium M19]